MSKRRSPGVSNRAAEHPSGRTPYDGYGNSAGRPSEIRKPGWRDIALRAKDEIKRDHLSLLAAGVAFKGLFVPRDRCGYIDMVAGRWALVPPAAER